MTCGVHPLVCTPRFFTGLTQKQTVRHCGYRPMTLPWSDSNIPDGNGKTCVPSPPSCCHLGPSACDGAIHPISFLQGDFVGQLLVVCFIQPCSLPLTDSLGSVLPPSTPTERQGNSQEIGSSLTPSIMMKLGSEGDSGGRVGSYSHRISFTVPFRPPLISTTAFQPSSPLL